MAVRDAIKEYMDSHAVIKAKDLAKIIEEQFDVTVRIEKNGNVLSVEERAGITKELTTNKEVIEQLKKARERRKDSGFSSFLHNKEEFDKFLSEVQSGR